MQTIQKLRVWSQDRSSLLVFCLFFAIGVVFDFVFVGVLKVAWIIVYGTTYFATALTLEAFISRSKYKPYSKTALTAFLIGTAIGHISLVGQRRIERYSMTLMGMDPILMKSPEFSDSLYLTSSKLNLALNQDKLKDGIQMVTRITTDYGCMRTFEIVSIDNVEIQADPDSTWTFRSSELGTFQSTNAPVLDKKQWPWCLIQFYRPSS